MILDSEGDHNGRFTLPDGRRASGTLSLASNSPPSVSLHPDVPTPIGSEGCGFPVNSVAEELVGHLYSRNEVIIGDVQLSEWFPDQFYASGRWALIGLSITKVPQRRWTSLNVRATGLECLLGNAISATSWPSGVDSRPLRYAVDLNADAEFVSTADGVTMTAAYDTTISVADPYRFNVSNYATATLAAEAPMTVDEWVSGWVDPLLALLGLATGERERANAITLAAPDARINGRAGPVPAEITGHLFGSAIHQKDQAAERRTRPDGTPVVPLFTLDSAPPLAVLLRMWQANLADETATSLYRLAIDPTLPTPVRYLLCAQALEALDASTNHSEEEAADAAHAEQRDVVMAALDQVAEDDLDAATKRFIWRNLARHPHRSLAGRLHRLIGLVPDHTSRAAAWTEQTEALATELERSGRGTSGPAR